MPLSIEELLADVSDDIAVNIGTDAKPQTFNIKIKPWALTPELEARIHATAQNRHIGAVYTVMLLDTLASWDLVGVEPLLPWLSVNDEESPEETAERLEGDKLIERDNELRAKPHILPITEETLSRIPNRVLEKIVEAVKDAQSPKKPNASRSSSSFGAGTAPVRRGIN